GQGPHDDVALADDAESRAVGVGDHDGPHPGVGHEPGHLLQRSAGGHGRDRTTAGFDRLHRELPGGQAAGGMITTGQGAWWATCWLTEPSRRPLNPPRPRDPTTSRSAPLAASTRTWDGPPAMTLGSTATPVVSIAAMASLRTFWASSA